MLHLSTVDAFKHIHSDDCITLDDEQLHSLQTCLNGILDDIASVCEENNIIYTLGGGSCLGAIRHQGFIPWDDDIDLNFPRADFDRFIPAFREKFGDKYWIHTPEASDNYGLLLTRIRLKGTSVKTKEDFFNSECGAFIDIFVIENTWDDPARRFFHGFLCSFFGFGLSCRKFWRDRKYLLSLVKDQPETKKVFRIKIALGFITALFSINWWTRVGNSVYRMCHNDHTKYVTVPSGRKHFWGELALRSDMCEAVAVPYDGKKRLVCKDYDKYLTRMYGDYMKLPSKDQIEKHSFFVPFYLGE